MAGVAGPMLRHDRWQGARFLVALAVGGILAGLVLAVPISLVGGLLARLLPLAVRLVLLAALAAALAAADLRGRTPHVWRQVPQTLANRLPPGTLGLVWGFDLGLLFTTQKTVSLLWLSIGAMLLLHPSAAVWALVTFAFTASAVVALWSFTPMADIKGRRSTVWLRRIRWASGSAMVVAAIGVAWAALPI